MPARKVWIRTGTILAIVAVIDTVLIGLLTNITTGGQLPSALEPHRAWAWACLGVVTIVGGMVARAQFRHGVGAQPQSLRPLVPAASNLPHRNPNFAGRATELEALRRELSHKRSIILVAQPQSAPGADQGPKVLIGMPGVGKTQLAIEYAYRYRSNYDIVWWVQAEQADLITASVARLGDRLMLPRPRPSHDWTAAVLAELQRRERWLLIFDDVRQPTDITSYLEDHPGGHVIATSRYRGWGDIATPLEVEVFNIDDARTYLTTRLAISVADADDLAAELGRLPLALAQAAAYIHECGITTDLYLTLWREHEPQMLRRGKAEPYPLNVHTTISLAVRKIRSQRLASYQLLCLYAFLAAEGIPDILSTAFGKGVLPSPLANATADTLQWQDTIGLLNAFSLIDRSDDAKSANVHRLVQATVRGMLTLREADRWLNCCTAMLDKAVSEADPHVAMSLKPMPRSLS
jgi:NB-ARC domain-containing protein